MFKESKPRRFQQGLDADKLRANRYKTSLTLRRKDRELHLQKRRRQIQKTHGTETGGNDIIIAKREDIQKYVICIKNWNGDKDEEKLLIAMTGLRQLVSLEHDPPITEVLNTGIIPKIIHFLNNSKKSDKIQFEAAWIMTNLCSTSNKEYTHKCVQIGAIEGFVNLLKSSKDETVVEQALWGLANICVEDMELRNRVILTKVLYFVINAYFNWSKIETKRTAIWMVSTLCIYTNVNEVGNRKLYTAAEHLVPCIAKVLADPHTKSDYKNKENLLMTNIIWILCNLSKIDFDDNHIIDLMMEHGIIKRMMTLLKKEYTIFQLSFEHNIGVKNGKEINNRHKSAILSMNSYITRPLISMISNIVTGTDKQTQCVLDYDLIECIQPFLNHFISSERKDSFWILSNILAGSTKQTELIINNDDVLKTIINTAQNDFIGVKKEALWCICNASYDGSTVIKKRLIQFGAICALCKSLQFIKGVNNTTAILDALESFLEIYQSSTYNPIAMEIEEYNGCEYLDNIISKNNNKLSDKLENKINNLLQKYFHGEDSSLDNINEQKENEFELNANIDKKTNQFMFGCTWNKQTENTKLENKNKINKENTKKQINKINHIQPVDKQTNHVTYQF